MQRLSVFMLIICFFSISASATAPFEGKDHLWWAERLLSEIDGANTGYAYQRNARGIV